MGAPNTTHIETWDADSDVWELYNLDADYTQAKDLAHAMPDKLAEMKSVFNTEAATHQVLPIGAGLYTMYYHPKDSAKTALTQWDLFAGQTRISAPNAPNFRSGFSSLSMISLEVPQNASGVLYCVGGLTGGFAVYMDAGYLHAEYKSALMYRYEAKSSKPLKPGPTTIKVELLYEKEPEMYPSANLTLMVGDETVGTARIEKSARILFDVSETFDVGMDLGSAVSPRYVDRLPFAFTGKINSLFVKYLHGPANRCEQELCGEETLPLII